MWNRPPTQTQSPQTQTLESQLQGVQIQGAQIPGSQVPGSHMQNAQIQNAQIPGAQIPNTQINAQLSGAENTPAHMHQTQSPGAQAHQTSAPKAQIPSARIPGANSLGTQNLGGHSTSTQGMGTQTIGSHTTSGQTSGPFTNTHNPSQTSYISQPTLQLPPSPIPQTPLTQTLPTQVARPDFDAELQLYVSSKQHKELLDRMNIVQRACFNAHNRLEQKHKVSVFSLSLISLFVVAISLYALTYGTLLPLATKSAITFSSIIASVFIIIVGLLESQNNYKVRAMQLHKCAMQITDLHQKLQIETSISRNELQEYADKYQQAIQACPYSHDDIDYVMAKIAGRRGHEIGWDLTTQVYLTYYLDVYGLNFVILAIPPAILFFL